jgi:PKD repeat protein
MFTSGSVSTATFVAAANSATPPNLLWFTPTDGHNMHDNSVQTGDAYLHDFLIGSTGSLASPASGSLLASNLFKPGHRTMLLLWWDEYDPAPILFYGTMVKQALISTSNLYDEYSVLHLFENNWALPTLTTNDAAALAMSEIYGITTPLPLTTSFTVVLSTPVVNVPVTLTALTTGGVAPYTVNWNFGDGTTGTGAALTHTFISVQSYTVTETATDSSTPKQTATSTQTISVVTSLPLSTSFAFLPVNPTVNSPVSFTAVTAGGTVPYTISWNFGDSATATGMTVSHTYATAQSFTVTETATDSSTPKQTTTATQTVIVSSSLTGNFDSTWFINNCPGGTETITNGVLQTRQSTPGGGPNSYGYCTAQRGTFPWHSTVGTALPSGITTVTSSFNFLSRSLLSGSRYHLYIALYYQIPSSTSGTTTYAWLDTQSRVENIGGTDSPVGSTATYDPSDSFGWDIVTLQVNPGQTGILTADVAQLCKGDLAAWGLPASTQCTLAGIEIGTEGYLLNSVNVDWLNVGLNIGPIPLSTSFTVSPGNPLVNKLVTFTSTTIGGTSPYTVSWNFGDGSTGTGTSIAHTYSTVQTFTVTEIAIDSSSPSQTTTSSKTVTTSTPPPPSTSFTSSPTNPTVNSPVTFTSTTTGGTAPYSITWAFGDGVSATGTTVPHTFTSAQTFTVTETATDSSSPSQTATSAKTLTVSPPPPLSTSFTFLPTTPLVSTLIAFTAVATSGTPPYAIAWNFGDGTTGTGPTITHTFTTAQSFIVTETATDSSSPKQTATSSQSVTIYITLPLSGTIRASSSSPQVGQTVTFTATATGGTAPYGFAISFGDGASATIRSSTHAYSAAGSYTVTLTVTDSASPRASSLATITVNVQAPSPLTLALPSNRTVTSGTWVNFTVAATSSDPARIVSLTVSQLPSGATFDPSTGVFSWRPSASQTGYYAITFVATDDSTPPVTSTHPMGIQVDRAAPTPPGGGSPGGSGGTPSGCLLCGTFPAVSSSMWLLMIGGLLGLVTSLALLTIKARASLEHTKRRLNRIQRDN